MVSNGKTEQVADVPRKLRRMTIVPDIASFWPSDRAQWTADGVARIMAHCDLDDRSSLRRPPLLIGNPRATVNSLCDDQSYADAWNIWASRYGKIHGSFDMIVWRYGSGRKVDQLRLGSRHGQPLSVRLYDRDYFGALGINVEDAASVGDAWIRLIKQHRMSLTELSLVNSRMPLKGQPLSAYFASDAIVASDHEAYLVQRYVEEVGVISGYTGDLHCSTFSVHRASQIYRPSR